MIIRQYFIISWVPVIGLKIHRKHLMAPCRMSNIPYGDYKYLHSRVAPWIYCSRDKTGRVFVNVAVGFLISHTLPSLLTRALVKRFPAAAPATHAYTLIAMATVGVNVVKPCSRVAKSPHPSHHLFEVRMFPFKVLLSGKWQINK